MSTDAPAPAKPDVRPDVGTSEQVATDPRPSTDDGDHDRYAHYIRKSDWDRAYIKGEPVRALCGKIWVPSRDPDRYPICPTCQEIRGLVLGGDGGGNDGDDEGGGAPS
ncbi:MAG: DUF3039 domain-containing protein [Actinobacteria bacterium]|nr:DUF3039 domain-containing protein [Actinomycetota bacterium]